ncbi:MAG: hypothetical protein CO029_04760 [Candidatus Magasanikbacteria bacterium CG_4_9_14_0_2_um_filter_41_10]|uniref:Methyltransferase type 11 domain-containing protein n=1 Tax=Candidatus Magasanikbacteria bacterium CG_4_10_14_0_2_um_filter_41_31 TaxID=1974639 RepID=A0A2M7V2T6_9BACT|nr:MAG: hypothetical protein AUJ37_03850 [Candidatus Magasanikbacteria bacterium CG1_02_41_34]PIZ92769.1 MAG: hypothetical protein COX83_03580 [Candidatus Magasanikbacteria bacterium CG_4_10_14_0_2_um_filter_41_31]PJC53050.1 MAG: hypothetical protein CO029_04760 [Candidatus Magasanikbacteria bacterium CG_4_9_14_0_2_um_filter_41_10]
MRDYQKETIDTYNKHAVSYQKSRINFLDTEKIDRFISLLSGKHILDIGCGPGRDSANFVEKGYVVIGIDLTKAFIELAKDTVPKATFKQMDVLDLLFSDNTFDGIWCNAVLLHLKKDDVRLALSEAFRVLKSGGIMYVSVKKGNSEETISDPRLADQKRFFSYIEKREIENIIADVGFDTIEIYESSVHNTIVLVEWINVFVKKPL